MNSNANSDFRVCVNGVQTFAAGGVGCSPGGTAGSCVLPVQNQPVIYYLTLSGGFLSLVAAYGSASTTVFSYYSPTYLNQTFNQYAFKTYNTATYNNSLTIPNDSSVTMSTVPSGYYSLATLTSGASYYVVSAPMNALPSTLQYYSAATNTFVASSTPPAGGSFVVTKTTTGITLTSNLTGSVTAYSSAQYCNAPLTNALFYPAAPVPSGYYLCSTVPTGNYYIVNAPNNILVSPAQYYETSSSSFVATTTATVGSSYYVAASTTGVTITSNVTGAVVGTYTFAQYYASAMGNGLFSPAPLPPPPAGYFTPATVASGNYYLVSAFNNQPISPLKYYVSASSTFVAGTTPPAGSNLYVTASSSGISLTDASTSAVVGTFTTSQYASGPLASAVFMPVPGNIVMNAALATAQSSMAPLLALIATATTSYTSAAGALKGLATNITGTSSGTSLQLNL